MSVYSIKRFVFYTFLVNLFFAVPVLARDKVSFDGQFSVPSDIPDGQSMVVFYRQDGVATQVPTILISDRVVGSLLPNTFSEAMVCGGMPVKFKVGERYNKEAVEGAVLQANVNAPAKGVVYVRLTDKKDAAKGFSTEIVQESVAKEALNATFKRSSVINRESPNCAVAQAEPERKVLGADALFPIGKSSMSDILKVGLAQIDALILDIQAKKSAVTKIIVTGHADRLGRPDSNQQLSLNRAASVARYMQQHGVNVPFETKGMGSSQPVVECSNSKLKSLVDCLQPNRRVTLDIYGM